MQTGQCLCGAVSFSVSGALGPSNYCHCTDCRRTTGSAFNVAVRAEAVGFAATGPLKSFTKNGDSGNPLTRHFCADCGSPIFTSSPMHPESVFIKAGAFDQPDIPPPSHQSWVGSRVSWGEISLDLPTFAKGKGQTG